MQENGYEPPIRISSKEISPPSNSFEVEEGFDVGRQCVTVTSEAADWPNSATWLLQPGRPQASVEEALQMYHWPKFLAHDTELVHRLPTLRLWKKSSLPNRALTVGLAARPAQTRCLTTAVYSLRPRPGGPLRPAPQFAVQVERHVWAKASVLGARKLLAEVVCILTYPDQGSMARTKVSKKRLVLLLGAHGAATRSYDRGKAFRTRNRFQMAHGLGL